MKRTLKGVLASIVVAGLVLATPQAIAQENQSEPSIPYSFERILTWDEEGNPTSGVVTFDVDTTIMKPRATENVGGGTWTYGSRYTSDGSKVCTSKYMHKTKTHTATATMGTITSTRTAKLGSWASASVTGGISAGVCNAYWSTNRFFR